MSVPGASVARLSAALLSLLVGPHAHAWMGALDPSFGTGGMVKTPGGGARAIVAAPDGRLVVVGDGFVARHRPNGSLDPSFGGTGRVRLPITGRAVALTGSGAVLAAGSGCAADGCGFAVARFTPAGALDPGFGSGGVSVLVFPGLDAAAWALAVDADGGLVLAGSATKDSASSDLALARFLRGGAPDTVFGSGGRVTTDLGGADDAARALVVLPDGIVAAGTSNGDFALARYDSAGRLVGSWGQAGGVTRTDFAGGGDRAWSIAVDGEGRLLVAGNAALSPSKSVAAVARYTSAGLLDESFGDRGRTTVDPGTPSAVAEAIVVLPGGGLVAAGSAADDPHEVASFAVFGLDAAGAPDAAFGSAGVVTSSFFGGGGIQEARAAALTPGGVVAAGYAMASTSDAPSEALARYLVGSPLSGDVNGDRVVDVSDVFALLGYLFGRGPAPQANGDVNGDGLVDTRDAFYLLNYVFAAGPAPVR